MLQQRRMSDVRAVLRYSALSDYEVLTGQRRGARLRLATDLRLVLEIGRAGDREAGEGRLVTLRHARAGLGGHRRRAGARAGGGAAGRAGGRGGPAAARLARRAVVVVAADRERHDDDHNGDDHQGADDRRDERRALARGLPGASFLQLAL